MKTALRARLLTALSATVGTRVDWGLRPQGKGLPAVTLNVISDPRDYHMGGADRTQQYRVQVDCYGATYAAANTVRDAVITCLEAAAGDFQASFVMDQRDYSERLDAGEVHQASADFKITYSA